MNPLTTHFIIAPLALGTPLLVTLIVLSVARRDGLTVYPRQRMGRLIAATALSFVTLLIWFVAERANIAAGSRNLLLGATEIAGSMAIFWLFAVPVMSAIQGSIVQSLHDDEERFRSASLTPRRLYDYIPKSLRMAFLVLYTLALAFLILRIASAGPGVNLIMPTVYGAVAVIFFALYEAWMRQEALSLPEGDESIRGKRVLAVFRGQNLLSALFLIMAFVALESPTAVLFLGPLSGLLGIVGCAFALSTGAQRRYLRKSVAS